MSWLARFRKQLKDDGNGRFDSELLRRLDALAFANAKVRKGDLDAAQINLSPNVNDQGVVEANRPSVSFRLQPLQRRDDVWSFLGSIDDATGYLRFLLELCVPNVQPLAPHQVDPDNMPGIEVTIRRHPEYEHGNLARSYCVTRWRADVDPSFLAEQSDGPLRSGTVVVGSRLTRTEAAYAIPDSGSWFLLKCTEPGPFFIAFDSTTGEAEMFPRRYDVNGYAFALDILRAIT
jgi:hypothetical protein